MKILKEIVINCSVKLHDLTRYKLYYIIFSFKYLLPYQSYLTILSEGKEYYMIYNKADNIGVIKRSIDTDYFNVRIVYYIFLVIYA